LDPGIRSGDSYLVNAEEERILTYVMREYPEPRPRNDQDAAREMARDLADIASHIG
jgi:hypothetical protein